MAKSPYIKGIGQLVLDRYTAQDHFEGIQFRHKATQVDLDPPINIIGFPASVTANTVQEALTDLAAYINSGGLTGYSVVQVAGVPVTPTRSILNFISGVTAVDNPLNLSTDITVIGGGSGITELTGDVLAGPGTGAQATTVNYLSGFTPLFDPTHTYVINQSEYLTLDYNILRTEKYGKLSALDPFNTRYDLAYISDTPTNSTNFGNSSLDMNLRSSFQIQMSSGSKDIAKAENDFLNRAYLTLQQGMKVPTINVNSGSYTVDSTSGLTDLEIDFALALGPCTLTLPKCEAGRVLILSDIANNFATFNLTLQPNFADSIKNGGAGNPYIIDISGYTGFLIGDSTGSNWVLTPTGYDSSYHRSFVSGDLSAGILTVTHNLNQKYVNVAVYDDTDALIVPNGITATNITSCDIDLSSYSISGTWNLVITA